MTKNKNLVWIAALLCLAATLFSCKDNNTDHTQKVTKVDSIIVSIDETLRFVFEQQKEVFESSFSNSYLQLEYKRELDCFDDLLNRRVPLAVVTRSLNETEQQFFKENNFFQKSNPVATEAMAVILHPSSPDSLMTLGQLRNILSGNFVRNYNLILDHPASSISNFVLDELIPDKKMPSNAYAISSIDSIISYVGMNANAISILPVKFLHKQGGSYSEIEEFVENVQIVSLKDDLTGSFYRPYQAYLALGHYPLKRNIQFVIRERGPSPATRFANFLWMEQGQLIFNKARYMPLHAPLNVRETVIVK